MHVAIFIVDLIVLGALGGAGYYGYLIARRLPTVSPPPRDGADAAAPRGEDLSALRGDVRGVRQVGEEARGELARLRDGLRSVERAIEERETLLRRHQDDTAAALDGRLKRVERDLLAQHEETRRRLAALLAGSPGDGATGQRRRERQREVLTDLYRRLAKIEVSIAAVTNPIQLPGEPYTVPTEFLPDTLRWENWKEVGESAFAFADAFNGCRLDLDDGSSAEIAAFVTSLRTALTESVYPNLQPRPTAEQRQALQSGLTQIGNEIAAIRARIALAYRGDRESEATAAQTTPGG